MKKTYLIMIAAMLLAGCGAEEETPKTTEKSPVTQAQNSQAEAVLSELDPEPDEDNSAEESLADETDDTENTDNIGENSSQAESSAAPEENQTGELLSAAAEIFSGEYTYSAQLSYSDEPENVIKVLMSQDGTDGSFYMSSAQDLGGTKFESVYFYDAKEGKAYDIDNTLGIYHECDKREELNLMKEIADRGLEMTSTRIPQDSETENTVEEYTYTGDTYITVYDFYFDSEGTPIKYTATYSVEGEDDLITTAQIDSIKPECDKDLFDLESLTDEIKDFDTLTDDERLGYCQGICGTYSISTDDMYTLDITTDDLKRISYDDFITLVYSFANRH